MNERSNGDTPWETNQTGSYCTWLSAIKHDDLDYVTETLTSAMTSSAEVRKALLNGHFTKLYDDMGARAGYFLARYRVDNAVLAAVVNGSRDVLQCLLDHGADPLITDDRGDNIAHTVISIVATHPKLEDSQLNNLKHFLAILPVDKRLKLLKTENKQHLVPLEYALIRGCIKMFRMIFTTDDVYRFKRRDLGYMIHEDYDITEYEVGQRKGLSPLTLLYFANEETMRNPEFVELLKWTPIRQWMTCKSKADILPCMFWAITILWYTAIYHLIKNKQPSVEGGTPEHLANGTNHSFVYCSSSVNHLLETVFADECSLKVLIFYGIIHSLLIIAVDIVELISISRHATLVNIVIEKVRSRHFLMSHLVLRLLMHISAWGVMAYYIMLRVGATLRGNTIFSIIALITDIGLFANATFMLLALRLLGYTPYIIAEMFMDLLYFSFIGIINILSFTIFFYDFVNVNTEDGCIEDFSGFFHTMYRVILIMLNIKDMTQYNTEAHTALLIGHAITAVILGVLYLNFLIASVTMRVFSDALIRNTVLTIYRLPIAMTVDTRLHLLCKFYPSYYRRKYLKVLDNENVYLSNVVSM